ncbi:MAG: sugar ABC transporter permease [Lachnospiraceae bacterium]|nr:sugar ABC transporter permease [Lachnospiraceae bacterium]
MKSTKKRMAFKRMKPYLPFYIMMLPGTIYLLINNYIPMAGLVVAFKKYSYAKGIWKSKWIGMDNFRIFFNTDMMKVIANTLGYNAVFIILSTVISVAVAILINDIKAEKMKKLFQTIFLVPHLISIVIIAYLAYAFLAGETGFLNNSILPLFGIEPITWYSTSKYWPFILTFVYLWKQFGYNAIIYYATIAGIDPTYYEAASVDGAGIWTKIRCITLPELKPTIITLTLMSIGRIFYSDFGLFYQVPMNSGSLIDATQTIDTYIYRGLINNSNIGMSSAACFVQSILGFILVLTSNWVVRKISKENALF